jgi:hypothetical protein
MASVFFSQEKKAAAPSQTEINKVIFFIWKEF